MKGANTVHEHGPPSARRWQATWSLLIGLKGLSHLQQRHRGCVSVCFLSTSEKGRWMLSRELTLSMNHCLYWTDASLSTGTMNPLSKHRMSVNKRKMFSDKVITSCHCHHINVTHDKSPRTNPRLSILVQPSCKQLYDGFYRDRPMVIKK